MPLLKGSSLTYQPTNRRPPKAQKELVTRLYRISPIASSLERALSGLIADDDNDSIENTHRNEIEVDKTLQSGDSSHSEKSHICSAIKIDEHMKSKLLDTYGDAIHEVEWEKPTAIPKPTGVDEENVSSGTRQCDPPAALLRGNLKYYNRMGGQWRIVVSGAEIRKRANLPLNKKTKEINGLWKTSVDTDSPSISLDGEIVIFAYDDA